MEVKTMHIIKAWEEQCNIFLLNLPLIGQAPGNENIHDFRVAVKHMRSYLNIMEALTGQNWREKFEGIRQIFSITGEQREWEISLSMLSKRGIKEQDGYKELYQFLERNFGHAVFRSRQAALDFDAAQLQTVTSIFKGSWETWNEKKIRKGICRYTGKLLGKVRKQANDLDQHAHRVRKLVKELLYSAEIFPDCLPETGVNLLALEQLQEGLGRWQDHKVLLNSIRTFRKAYCVKKSTEYHYVKMLEKKTKRKMEKLLSSSGTFLHQILP